MKNKKLLAAFAVSAVLAVSGGAMAGCDKHKWSDDWSKDATNHWHACLDEDCTEKKDEVKHVDADEDGECDVCHYELETEGGEEHEHTYAEEWSKDKTGHWHAATCEHDTLKADEAEHEDADEDGECDVCHYVLKTGGEEKPTPPATVTEFAEMVEAIATLDNTADKAAIDAANTAIKTANASYNGLSAEDKEAATETKVSLEAKETALNNAINAQYTAYETAVAAAEEASDTDLEAAVAAANAKKTALAEATKEAKATEIEACDSRLATVEATLDELKTAQATVTALKVRVDAIDDETEVTLEYYNTLTALKAEITVLTGKAAELWDEDDTAIVEAEITRVETTVVKSNDDIEIFVNGANGSVYVLYEAINILGNNISGLSPELTVTIDAGATVNTSEATFTENNGIYIYTVNFAKKGGEAATEAGYELKVEYTIGDGEKQTVVYKEIKDDIYFNGSEYVMIKNDKIDYSGAPGFEAYVDIYETKNISIGENNSADPTISGLPLVKEIPVTNGMTVEALRKQLALSYSDLLIDKEYEVRFVLYRKTVDEETGAITISNIKNALVSHDTYTLNLTAEDKKERINLGGAGTVIGTDGGITIGAAYDAATLAAQFNDEAVTASNVHNYLSYKIYVTLGDETKYFIIDCPQGGSPSASVMKANVFKLFHDSAANEYTIDLQLILREDSPYSDILRESAVRTYAWNVQVSLPGNEAQVRFDGAGSGNAFEFVRSDKGNGSVFSFGVSYIELKFEKDGQSYTAYMYNDDGQMYIYSNTDKTGESLHCADIGNSWTYIDTFNNWVNGRYSTTGFDAKAGWSFTTKVIYDSEYNGATDGGESAPVIHGSAQA